MSARLTVAEFQHRQKVTELGPRFLSYVDEGPAGQEAVVLLHGIPTWGYLWHELIGELAPTNRVLAPDLLGFGNSDKSDRFDRSIGRQAEAIELWLDHLGIARATFVGHDLGGGVALRLATLHPERVRALVLINSVCYDSWPIELMLQLGHPGAHRKLSGRALGLLLRAALGRGFGRRPEPGVVEALCAPYTTDVGKLSLIRAAVALNTNLTTELTALLPQIRVPVLILWGADDRFQPLRYGERLAGDIPGARLVRLDGARHFAMLDRAGDVAWHVREMLAPSPVRVEARPAVAP